MSTPGKACPSVTARGAANAGAGGAAMICAGAAKMTGAGSSGEAARPAMPATLQAMTGDDTTANVLGTTPDGENETLKVDETW